MLPYKLFEKPIITKYEHYPNAKKAKVYYSDSSIEEIYYNENIRKRLNGIMEKQIEDINKHLISNLENDDKERTLEGFLWAICFALSLNIIKNDFFGMLPLTISSYGLFKTVGEKVMLDQTLNDIYKRKMFIENKKLLEKLDKYNPLHLKRVSGKAKKKIIKSANEPILDINFIDGISYKDLLRIRKNLNEYYDKENHFSKRLGI